MVTKAQQQKRTTISKVYIVVLLVLFLLASIKWIRQYTDPNRDEFDTIDKVSFAAESLLVPVLFFGIGLLMFTTGIFTPVAVTLMVLSAVMFGFALYNVVISLKEAALDFIDPINPFSR